MNLLIAKNKVEASDGKYSEFHSWDSEAEKEREEEVLSFVWKNRIETTITRKNGKVIAIKNLKLEEN